MKKQNENNQESETIDAIYNRSNPTHEAALPHTYTTVAMHTSILIILVYDIKPIFKSGFSNVNPPRNILRRDHVVLIVMNITQASCIYGMCLIRNKQTYSFLSRMKLLTF